MGNLYHKILDEHGGKIGLILCGVSAVIAVSGIVSLF